MIISCRIFQVITGTLWSRFTLSFFPDYKKVDLPKTEGEIWVCIPGQVDHNRRDYADLLQALKQQKPTAGIKFIVLGRDKKPGQKN